MLKEFNSKLLLFGEHSVIKYSRALAIPYARYSGQLDFRRSEIIDTEFKSFVSYLEKFAQETPCHLDLKRLKADVLKGLYFNSAIPQGRGLGSSAALCAAIYDAYKIEEISDFMLLKNIFSWMESHFHGTSSGMDPLISYLNGPLLFKADTCPEKIRDFPEYKKGNGAIFLLNTQRPRKTDALVNLFLEKLGFESFDKLCRVDLTKITHDCIDFFLAKEKDALYESFAKLSLFQYEHFLPMIPRLYQDLWQLGLDSKEFFLKLCGAGGGGFILGITRDFSIFQKKLSDEDLQIVFPY